MKSVAGRGDLAAAQALVPLADDLDAFSLAALALTLEQEGDSATAQTLMDKLIDLAEETPTTAVLARPARIPLLLAHHVLGGEEHRPGPAGVGAIAAG